MAARAEKKTIERKLSSQDFVPEERSPGGTRQVTVKEKPKEKAGRDKAAFGFE